MAHRGLKFGIFLAPFHRLGDNPNLAIRRDIEMLEWLDHLGYDEAWIGEHHSAGWEVIASPELIIAAAAERTKHIKLGSGVTSLPYHHPLLVAQRFVQLDHMTRGRAMLGCGPGALVSDAFMMGIPVAKQRDRMDEALDVLAPLLRGETVTHKSDWFELNNARLQMTPYSRPGVEMAVASQVSPTGARAAGKHGIGLLSLGATSTAGFNALASNWAIAEGMAADNGKTVDRSGWRLVGPMHIAETREQAYRDVEHGIEAWFDYFQHTAAFPQMDVGESSSVKEHIEFVNESGLGAIGTPDDAVDQIERLVKQSGGGFGAYLQVAQDWAATPAKYRSYELFARHVAPRFQGHQQPTLDARARARAVRPELAQSNLAAVEAATAKYEAELAEGR